MTRSSASSWADSSVTSHVAFSHPESSAPSSMESNRTQIIHHLLLIRRHLKWKEKAALPDLWSHFRLDDPSSLAARMSRRWISLGPFTCSTGISGKKIVKSDLQETHPSKITLIWILDYCIRVTLTNEVSRIIVRTDVESHVGEVFYDVCYVAKVRRLHEKSAERR